MSDVNVSLQSTNQPQRCEQMLEAMTRDDGESLLIVTSTQRLSVSSKLLQIFSPLYRDILRDIPGIGSNSDPVTLILPDTEAGHVKQLFDVLKRGKVWLYHASCSWGSAWDISTLAERFKIVVRDTDLKVPLPMPPKDIAGQNPRIRVRNIQEMLYPVPSETLNEIKTGKHNFPNIINIDDEIEIEERITTKLEDNLKGYECSFSQSNIQINDSGSHEEEHCLVRNDIWTFKCLSCGQSHRSQESLFEHMRLEHYPNLRLFHCSLCSCKFSKEALLNKHISKFHNKNVINLVYKFSEVEGPPSCFYSFDREEEKFFGTSSSSSGSGASAFAAPPATVGFSFGGFGSASSSTPAASNAEKKDEAEEDEDSPPVVEVKQVEESDALYSKKCKLFYKKEGNYVEKGVGMLWTAARPSC